MYIELRVTSGTATPELRRTLVPVETLTVRERPRPANGCRADIWLAGQWRGIAETYDEVLDRLRSALGLEHLGTVEAAAACADPVEELAARDALAEELSTLRDRDVEDADRDDSGELITGLYRRGWHLTFRDVS